MTRPPAAADAVEQAIERIGTRLDASPLIVLLDLDGTLAPIAPTPALAQVPASTRFVLDRLAQLPGVVMALVSGRGAGDAHQVGAVAGAWVIGNHGYELMDPHGTVTVRPEAAAYESAMVEAARQLASLDFVEGALVENKRWTLSVHYRNVKADVAALTTRARKVAAELGLRVTEGKKVIELRPPIAVDKGSASLEFVRRHGLLPNGVALYAGDDRTDEDAFCALRPTDRAVTIQVGASQETGAEIQLASPAELHEILSWLVTRRMSLT